MASVYKWRVSGNTYAYITNKNESTGTPIITGEYTIDNDAVIASYVKGYNEQTYSTQYDRLVDLMSQTPACSGLTMLDYKYYYDIDPTVCGFPQQEIGPQGSHGTPGTPGLKGDKGDPGVGIASITTQQILGGVRLTISFTDGRTPVTFDVNNGINGLTPSIESISGSIISTVVMEVTGQAAQEASDTIINQFGAYYENKFSTAQQAIDQLNQLLGTQGNSIVTIQGRLNTTDGTIEDMITGLNVSAQTMTQMNTKINALSGVSSYHQETIDNITSSLTTYDRDIDTLSGIVSETIETISVVSGTVSSYSENYAALDNSYTRTVKLLTGEIQPDSSWTDPVELELSEIYQSSNEVSALVRNGDGSISAGLILAINDNTSSAVISADQIFIDGDLIAEAITGTSITLASGNTVGSYFDADGSGYLAGNNIRWTNTGDMEISNHAHITDVSIDNADIESVTIDSANIENSVLEDVIVKGSLVTPWVTANQTLIGDYAKSVNYSYRLNAAFATDLKTEGILTWDYRDNGRTISIGNFGDEQATAWSTLTLKVPNGSTCKYYYYGIRADRIELNREMVTLIGYGEGQNFYGYIVTNRVQISANEFCGGEEKVLLRAILLPNSSEIIYSTFDHSHLNCRYNLNTNLIEFGLPVAWRDLIGDDITKNILPTITGYGTANNYPVVANIERIENYGQYFANAGVIFIALTANGQLLDSIYSAGFTMTVENIKDFPVQTTPIDFVTPS